MPAPNGVAVKKGVPSAGVIHLRYSTNPEAPWRGISPLTRGKTGISLLGLVEKALTAENRLPSSIAIPIMRENITKERTNTIIDALNQSDGSVLLWESPVAQVRGDDKGASFTSGRLRPEPSVPSSNDFWIERLESATGIGNRHTPVHTTLACVDALRPRRYFGPQLA